MSPKKLITTTVGSYPAKGLEPQDAIRRAVEDQLAAGIDLLTDGQVRADMIGIFARHIPGYDSSGPGYRIVGKIESASGGITVEDYRFAQSVAGTAAEVKGVLTGPTTMAMASTVEEGSPYGSNVDPTLILDISDVLAAEARALKAAGARVIQVDEPFFSLEANLDVGFQALERVTAHIPLSILHVCGDIRPIFDRLLEAPVNVLDIEGANLQDLSWADPIFLKKKGKSISYGCVNTNSDDLEEVEEIRNRIRAAISQVGAENIWISPDCGMKLRKREVAREKLKRMAGAARSVEQEVC